MDWNNILTIVITSLLSGGLVGGIIRLLTIRDKRKQEREKTAQAHETTRQEEIETAVKNFQYLKDRAIYAEKHIPELHKAMELQQKINNDLHNEISTLKEEMRILKEALSYTKRWVCYDKNCGHRIREEHLTDIKTRCDD